MSSKRNQTFSIDDAFEEENTDAIRVYGATTTTTERSPLNMYNRNGYISPAATTSGGTPTADDVHVQIHDPSNPPSIRPILRGLSKIKMEIDVSSCKCPYSHVNS